MGQIKSFFKVIFGRLIGLLIFLVLLGIANLLKYVINNQVFLEVVQFLNINLKLIIIIGLIFLVSDLFWILVFPFNLPAPILSAIASIFVITFLFKVGFLIEKFLEISFLSKIEPFSTGIYLLVFFIVLISGYFSIFSKIGIRERREIWVEKRVEKKEIPIKKEKQERKVEWKDVSEEIKGVLYDSALSLRKSINKKPERKSKKQKKIKKGKKKKK